MPPEQPQQPAIDPSTINPETGQPFDFSIDPFSGKPYTKPDKVQTPATPPAQKALPLPGDGRLEEDPFKQPFEYKPDLGIRDILPDAIVQQGDKIGQFVNPEASVYKVIQDLAPIAGFGSKVIDQIERPFYGSTKFLDSYFGKAKQSFASALADGAQEFLDPKDRLNYAELMRRNNPEAAEKHPIMTETMGFLADLMFDPLTYASFGTGRAVKMLDEAAKEISLSKKGAKALKGLVENANLGSVMMPMDSVQARRTAESQFLKLVAQDPSLLTDNYFRIGGSTLGTDKVQKFAKEVLAGFNDISSATDRAEGVTRKLFPKDPEQVSLRELFSRNLNLPEKMVQRRSLYEGEKETVRRQVEGTLHQLFDNMPIESRNKIVEVGHAVDQVTKQTAEAIGRPLTDFELLALRRQIANGRNMSPKEFQVYGRLLHDFEEIATLEMRAGLLKGTRQNYFPRMYDAIDNSQAFMYGMGQGADNPNLITRLNSSEKRVYETIEAAQLAGLHPEMDALTVYATRMLDGKKKLAHAQFQDDLFRMFGVENVEQLPRRVQEDLRFIGESLYPKGMGGAAHKLATEYDKYQNIFKKAATVVKPAFGLKQAPANLSAMYAVGGGRTLIDPLAMLEGAKTFGVLDPRSLRDAQLVIEGVNGKIAPEELQKMLVKSALGDRYTGNDLVKIFNEGNVLRGSQIGDVKFSRDVKAEIDAKQALTAKHQLFFGDKVGEKTADWANTFTKSINWAHWPGKIEDLSRATMVMNGLRIGHSPEMAVRLADKALFNYSEGLSKEEKRWVRRLLPFYSYQRFAVPLFLDVMASSPGRAANIAKTMNFGAGMVTNFMRSIEKVNRGETLSPTERRLGVADYILEQPHAFNRMDEHNLAVWQTFNNFALNDVLGTVELNDKGEIDIARSLRKSAIAQLTPWLKVPLEMMLEKKLFTDQAIKETGKIGNLAWIGKMLPENVKQAIHWEDGVSPSTGRPTTYVNPYALYAVSSALPVLGEIFKLGNPDNTPWEKVASAVLGITTIKTDLKANLQQKAIKAQKDIQDKKSEARRHLMQKRFQTFHEDMAAYRELGERIRDQFKNAGGVRGHGNDAYADQLREMGLGAPEEQSVPPVIPPGLQPDK